MPEKSKFIIFFQRNFSPFVTPHLNDHRAKLWFLQRRSGLRPSASSLSDPPRCFLLWSITFLKETIDQCGDGEHSRTLSVYIFAQICGTFRCREKDIQVYTQELLYESVFSGHRKRNFHRKNKPSVWHHLPGLWETRTQENLNMPKLKLPLTLHFSPRRLRGASPRVLRARAGQSHAPAPALPLTPHEHTHSGNSSSHQFQPFLTPPEGEKDSQEHIIGGHIINRRGSRDQFSQLKYYYEIKKKIRKTPLSWPILNWCKETRLPTKHVRQNTV